MLLCSEQNEDARMLIKMIAVSADAGPGGWNGLKRKLLHLDIDGSGAVNTDGECAVRSKATLCYAYVSCKCFESSSSCC